MCEACKKTDAEVEAEAQGKALEWARTYAWDWFVYHAGQRTSMFNYGIAAAAILAAGYGSAIEKHAAVSCGIGLVGVLVCLSFVRVDARNKFLVDRGEAVLRAVEASLFPKVSVGSADFVKPAGILTAITAADTEDGPAKSFWKGKHRIHMRWVQIVFMVAFGVGAVSAYQKSQQPEVRDEVAVATTTLATNVSAMATDVSSMAKNVAALSAGLDKMTSAIEADTRAREAAAKAQAAASQPRRSQGAK